MRDLLKPTLLCWETRNWRHQKQAVEWCKNYGLTPLTRTVYAGNLKTKEIKLIEDNFQKLFVNKTEAYYFFPLHNFTISQLTGKKDHAKEKLSEDSEFEIV